MMIDCESARQWLAHPGAGGSKGLPEDSAPYAAHIAGCAPCKILLQRYEAFTGQCQRALSHSLNPEAEARFLAVATAGEQLAAAAKHMEDASAILPDTAMEALAYTPSASLETDFLQAARAQHADNAVIQMAPRYWKPAAAVAAAAVLMVVIWSQNPEGFTESTPVAITAKAPMQKPKAPTHAASVAMTPKTSADSPIQIVSQAGGVLLNGNTLHTKALSSLDEGTVITTAASSHIEIRDESNATIRVHPESRLEFAAWGTLSTQLLLRSGKIHAVVNEREPTEPFEILTANARVTVVGTEFSVSYSKTGQTIVQGTSGKVRVTRKDGSMVGFVTAGQTLKVEPVYAMKKPVKGKVFAEDKASMKMAEAIHNTAPAPENAMVATHAPDEEAPDAESPPVEEIKLTLAPDEIEPLSVLIEKENAAMEQAAMPVEKAKPDMSPLQQARQLLSQGHVQEAITVLSELESDAWQHHALLGDAHQLAGQYGVAESAYRYALRQTPPPPPALFVELAMMQEDQLKDLDAAGQTWKRYLESDPQGEDAARAHLRIARLNLNGEDNQEAERHLHTILDTFPKAHESDVALTLLGRHLLTGERWAEAETLFEPYAQTESNRKAETSLVGLIRVRIAQGDGAGAKRLIAQYEKRFPNGDRGLEVARLKSVVSKP